MVYIPGVETLIAKTVGGLLAHSGPTAGTHAAMHATANTVAAANSSGSALGAAKTLATGAAAIQKVAKETEKAQADK